MLYNTKNKYYKYYNKEGIKVRIKMNINNVFFNNSKQIHVKFKSKDQEGWMHNIPNKQFNNIFDIIKYLCSNTTNHNMVFKVSLLKS